MTEVQAISTPKLARVMIAFAMAPLAGTLAFVMPIALDLLDLPEQPAYMLAVHIEVLKIASFVTFIYALASTIILGIPLYYLLRKRVLLSPMVSILSLIHI